MRGEPDVQPLHLVADGGCMRVVALKFRGSGVYLDKKVLIAPKCINHASL